ncbi:S-adenosyl-L-homocysteine hydrolase [Erythrobacter mangrovi]|uniref:S-adenosyl-L-homocysteine hydrolase n=1 Tax=Erythrobacter mangrovi TaxID=2739433 RepID=A0A7D3XB86_9SPHN|nr:S-adenosyl-L-homocysteine hydrolase [Erythrobacter mangrovi]QKG71390.1 S-adenosyl-L-homocysteine hydrolase [Erythrobacter mangrovi]
MQKSGHLAAIAGAAAAFLMPLSALATTHNEAEQIRRLDIMLMVTSLRCRTGGDNFQPQYNRFSANHLATLNNAARTLETDLVRQHGARGAKRALDKISVGIANEYGQGHPWLGCGELKQIATELSQSKNSADLTLAANELLASGPRIGGRFAAR